MTDPTQPKSTPSKSRPGQEVGGAPTGVTDGNLTRSMELGDFMEQLGLVMRLPRRKKGKHTEAHPAEPPASAGMKRPTSSGVWWGPLLLLGATIALGYLAFAPPVADDPLPPAALGRWITDDPRFVERGFTLDSLSVVFYTGSETADFTRHSIVGTTVRTDHGKELVSVDYVVGDGTMTLAFWVEPGPEPTIHFMNQPDITWKRGYWPGR